MVCIFMQDTPNEQFNDFDSSYVCIKYILVSISHIFPCFFRKLGNTLVAYVLISYIVEWVQWVLCMCGYNRSRETFLLQACS